MTTSEKKICRYFNTPGGCWFEDNCKFLHLPNKKPQCKFYGLITGCRFGEQCHFSHDRMPFKSVENLNNPSIQEIIKEVMKENMDPNEITGTNNNNLNQLLLSSNVDHNTFCGLVGKKSNAPYLEEICNSGEDVGSGPNKHIPSLLDSNMKILESEQINQSSSPNNLIATIPEETCLDNNLINNNNKNNKNNDDDDDNNNTNNNSTLFSKSSPSNSTLEYSSSKSESTNQYYTVSQDESLIPSFDNRSTTNEINIYCGSCKQCVEPNRPNESYCTILKNHYLKCFMEKEGDHVKYVKLKASLDLGQMYWCKSCILIFEKPWSLFQHMADKVKSTNVARWEKKIHLDWMDNVAALMAGYDLGLFSLSKLKIDLYNLLADYPYSIEEEFEAAAALTTAAMLQWLTPPMNPHNTWRLQQRELMRKIEYLNRQMYIKTNPHWMYPLLGNGYPHLAKPNEIISSTNTNFNLKYSTHNRSLISPKLIFSKLEQSNKKEIKENKLISIHFDNQKLTNTPIVGPIGDSIVDNEQNGIKLSNYSPNYKVTHLINSSGDDGESKTSNPSLLNNQEQEKEQVEDLINPDPYFDHTSTKDTNNTNSYQDDNQNKNVNNNIDDDNDDDDDDDDVDVDVDNDNDDDDDDNDVNDDNNDYEKDSDNDANNNHNNNNNNNNNGNLDKKHSEVKSSHSKFTNKQSNLKFDKYQILKTGTESTNYWTYLKLKNQKINSNHTYYHRVHSLHGSKLNRNWNPMNGTLDQTKFAHPKQYLFKSPPGFHTTDNGHHHHHHHHHHCNQMVHSLNNETQNVLDNWSNNL